MFIYEGFVTRQENGRYYAAIIKVDHDVNAPNFDTVADREFDDIKDADIWVDDEISRLTTGRGIWE